MDTEIIARFGIFLGVLLLMLAWEWRRPFRHFLQTKSERIAINLGLMGVNFIALRLFSGGGGIFLRRICINPRIGLIQPSIDADMVQRADLSGRVGCCDLFATHYFPSSANVMAFAQSSS